MFGRLAARANAAPKRLLDAARMTSVGVTAALGQFVIDAPTGLFGISRATTVVGLIYAALMLVGSLVCAIATIITHGAAWTRWVFAILVALGLTAFVPALAVDVGIAGAIVSWQLVVLTRLFVDIGASERGPVAAEGDTPRHRATASHLLLLSTFVTTLIVGFRVADQPGLQVVCVVLDTVAIVSALLVLRHARIPSWLPATIVASLLALSLAIRPELVPTLATLGVAQVALLLLTVREGRLSHELVEQFIQRPALLVLATFAGVAACGAVLLTFPAAAADGRVSPLDALFTSTSATCVTGLIVVDTPTAFSPFGQAIILVLIQIGGLGMMVLSTFATIMLGGRLTLRGEQALGHVLELSAPANAYRLVRFIVAATLAIEALGAGLLFVAYRNHGLEPADAVWRATFHAISAFCNAGFSLQTDSIMMFASDPLALTVHAVLIVLGGLGFAVLAWVWMRFVRRSRGRPPVQVRVVLWFSALLLLGGALLYGILEWNASLAELAPADKLLNAAFQSVTLRTAGFNSVDLELMRPATVLAVLLFMFIGAAPGGTGGGIKVTTVAVLAAAIPELLSARGGATLFGRSIPAAILQRAATIAVVASMTAALSLFLLLLTEDAPFVMLAFEAVSALGTVGLSLGATGLLTTTGKWVIIATMFIGRVGPLTLALALGRRAKPPLAYPEARIMVG